MSSVLNVLDLGWLVLDVFVSPCGRALALCANLCGQLQLKTTAQQQQTNLTSLYEHFFSLFLSKERKKEIGAKR